MRQIPLSSAQKRCNIFSHLQQQSHSLMSLSDKLLDCQSLKMEEVQERIRCPLHLTTLPHYLQVNISHSLSLENKAKCKEHLVNKLMGYIILYNFQTLTLMCQISSSQLCRFAEKYS